MYRAVVDPYCYSGTTVLKNRLGLRMQADLDAFEADATAQRFSEPLPMGRFGVRHYCAIHRHIFEDVYRWAGCFRSVRIAKGASMFCYPEHIAAEMARIFDGLRNDGCLRDLPVDLFATRSARFLSELNAVHPFRDGNGRAQLAFFALLADHAGRTPKLHRLKAESFLAAMIESFHGREEKLISEIGRLVS